MGDTCNIHPPSKQFPGRRLAAAALHIVYGKGNAWRHPTYKSASASGTASLTVSLNDVAATGLVLKQAANAVPGGATDAWCQTTNAGNPFTCAWASLQYDDAAATWVNATVGLSADAQKLVITPAAAVPAGATRITASTYGWGSIPLLTVYDTVTDTPVLPFNQTV